MLSRLGAALRRRRAPAVRLLDPDDPALVVLVSAMDPAQADSAVLQAARDRGVDPGQPFVVRHHLRAAGGAQALGAAVRAALGPEPGQQVRTAGPDLVHVVVAVPALDALDLARTRTRMAGLAQRLGGDALGWDALAPAADL